MEHELNQHNELEFAEEWISLQKYPFKILAIVTVLADDKKAFRGTLNDLCDNLGIQRSSGNKNKIKETLKILESKEYIRLIIDKDVYTISLSKSMEKSKKIIRIKKAWYKLIREMPCSAAWENSLKVFLTILEFRSEKIYTYKEIGEKVGLSKSTISSCMTALKKVDFGDLLLDINTEKEKYHDNESGETEFRTKGQTYQPMLIF